MKDQIIKLRLEGKSYSEIQKLIGCSKGTIAYHCGTGQKAKYAINRSRARRQFKVKLKLDFGGKCKICKYDKCLDALDFHHISGDKIGDVSDLTYQKGHKVAKKEAEKCILICANCHRELHSKEQNGQADGTRTTSTHTH
jgi:hypothetical protein